jgi:beta-mannosidase
MVKKVSLDARWAFSCKKWLSQAKVGDSTLEWLPAVVPGHVHLDLVAASVIADPFTGLAELGCQWVDEEDWCFRGDFEYSPSASGGRRILRFDGLDCIGSVSLNGTLLGTFNNMFEPVEFDVTNRLRAGSNYLLVAFESADRVANERRDRYLLEQGLSPDIERLHARAFVRKAQYMFGWDWGPRLVSAGIWQPVWLLEVGVSRLTDVWIRQQHEPDGSVTLNIDATTEGLGQVVHVVLGLPGVFLEGQPIRIEQPDLWWPAGFGSQALYTVTSYLLDVDQPTSELDAGRLLDLAIDQRTTRVGLRQLRLRQQPDRFGRSFEFEVNGRPIWCTGANWIPDHSFPSQVTRERLQAQLGRARDMNMNMLRVWGGGLYESDDFYELCDELGVLVWQDFPFACSYSPDDVPSQREAAREAASNVRRLRNHASLALWCGNNENRMMFEAKWGRAEHHPERCLGDRIWLETLPAVLAGLDPDRPYLPTSPWGGTPANCDVEGDQHNWDVWHGRGDWRFYTESRARFPSEFGFAGAPTRAAWQRMAPANVEMGELSFRHALARWHDKTAKGYETFVGFVELHYPAVSTIEEWTYTSQLNQRDALRCGIEHYRRSEFAKGALIWQFNDCWPVQSWSALDSEAGYKALAFELRRLYAPCLVSIELVEDTARVWVVLDNTLQANAGSVRVQCTDLRTGAVMGAWEQPHHAVPGSRDVALEINVRQFVQARSLLTAEFAGNRAWQLLGEPKHAEVAVPALKGRFSDGQFELTTDVPLVDGFLAAEDGAAQFLDNFVTLPVAGSVALRAQGTSLHVTLRTLRGKYPVAVASHA